MTPFLPVELNAILSLLALGSFCVWLIASERDWTSPISLVSTWILVFISIDGLFTAFTGTYGLKDYDRTPIRADELLEPTLIWTFALAFFALGFKVLARQNVQIGIPAFAMNKDQPLASRNKRVESALLTVSAILTLGTIYIVTKKGIEVGLKAGTIGAARNLVFSDGGGPLLAALTLFKVCVLLLVFRDFEYGTFKIKRAWPYLVAATLPDLYVGSRTAVVLTYLIPVMIAYHVFVKPIRFGKLAAFGLAIIVFIVPIYRTLTRDVVYDRNRGYTASELVVRNLTDLPTLLFGGSEITALDGTIDVLRNRDKWFGLGGETLLQAPLSVAPRAILPDKAYGGASTIFTNQTHPEYYHRERSEALCTYAGELVMNFGWLGVPIGFFLLGVACALLAAWPKSSGQLSPARYLIYVLIMGRVLGLLRGDTFGFFGQISFFIIDIAALIGFEFLLSVLFPPKADSVSRVVAREKIA